MHRRLSAGCLFERNSRNVYVSRSCLSHSMEEKMKEIIERLLSRSKYHQLLPPDWIDSLTKQPRFFTIEDCINDRIVYPVVSAKLGKLNHWFQRDKWLYPMYCRFIYFSSFWKAQKMDRLQLSWEEDPWCETFCN